VLGNELATGNQDTPSKECPYAFKTTSKHIVTDKQLCIVVDTSEFVFGYNFVGWVLAQTK
jgi:hypothetical protein